MESGTTVPASSSNDGTNNGVVVAAQTTVEAVLVEVMIQVQYFLHHFNTVLKK